MHNYVYKLEGLLAKESGRIRSEESNRSGGFLQDCKTRSKSNGYRKRQGARRKTTRPFFFLRPGASREGTAALSGQITGDSAA
jgi:hypothetical protein